MTRLSRLQLKACYSVNVIDMSHGKISWLTYTRVLNKNYGEKRQNLASGLGSLVLSQCCGHVTWKNILVNVLKQDLVYGETKARTWYREYQDWLYI